VRLVLDSNIIVRAFVSSHGLAHDLLLAILSGGHTLILSNEVLVEVAGCSAIRA
jgi:predicted nucleic acid-binding protein